MGRRTAAKNRDKDLLTGCRFRDTPNPRNSFLPGFPSPKRRGPDQRQLTGASCESLRRAA